MMSRKSGAVRLAMILTACLASPAYAEEASSEAAGGTADLTVFAAASMTETLTELADMYRKENPGTDISFNFDSSGTLATQILQGADCDIFLSAAQKQMNELDRDQGTDTNPDGHDFLLPGTRVDLLENKVALAVPDGNPKGITGFDDLAKRLGSPDKEEEFLLAIGNSDVPVGQYTQKILDYYGLSEEELADAGRLTYGSNVKEVTTQVSEGSVDCGIIYQTDAYSEGLAVEDTAAPDMCGRVIYPAAVLKDSRYPAEAKAFLAYLQSPEARSVFEKVGFTPLSGEAETESETEK